MDCALNLFKYEIVQLNIRGARSNKLNIENYLAEMKFPEVICLNETKLPLNKQFEIDGYTVSARRESGVNGGSRGSMILTRRDVTDVCEIEEVKHLFKYDEIIGIEIRGSNSRPSIEIFCYYNPPLSTPNADIIRYVGSRHGKSILTGDLNCKNTLWGSTKTEARGIELLHCLNINGLIILNDESKTRCDPYSGKEESLDLFVGNAQSAQLLKEFRVGFDVGSDHFPVHALLQFGSGVHNSPRKVRRPQKLNQTQWNRVLGEHGSIAKARSPNELENNAKIMTAQIKDAYERCCPVTLIKNRPKCIFTPEIRAKVKEKRKMRREKNEALQRQDFAQVRILMTKINRLGNEIKRLQKCEKKREMERHCHSLNSESNPHKFFKTFGILNQSLGNKEIRSSQKPVEDEIGNKAATGKDKAKLFADRLQRIHQVPNYAGFDEGWKNTVDDFVAANGKTFKTDKNESYSQEEDGDDSTLCKDVSLEELERNLTKCKNKSAVGEDGISYLLIKKLPKTAKSNLCQIYSDSLRLGYFPELWRTAIVKLIPKPNKDSKFAKNFRPISLLSCVGKVLERIIASRLSAFMEEKNLFSKTQSGFRRKHMTTEQLLRLSEESYAGFKKQQTTAALFLDAEAAFDRCWHSGIKYKLKKTLNLPNRFVRLISSFLSDRTLKVFYEGHYSSHVTLGAGTPQGSPLSPLIYIIYVNDYPKEIQDICSLSQFADDTALWATAYTRSFAISKLQKALNLLEGWCRRWRVKLNGDKSNLILISRTREKLDENFGLHLFNDVIRPTQSAKFLGVEIDSMLSFKKHIDSVCDRSTRRLNVLKVLAYNGVDPPTLMKLYKIYVRPIIEYGSIAFSTAPRTQLLRLEQIQNEAIRTALRLPRYIRKNLLNEYASIQPINDRLLQLNTSLLNTMKQKNDHVRCIIQNHLPASDNCHLSPLDIIFNR